MAEPAYRYFAIVSENYPRQNPFGLVRAWGGEDRRTFEESFVPQLVWKRDNLLDRISRGSASWDDEEITEAEAMHVLEILTARFKVEMEETRRILGE
jgi:hypothetical protein